MITIDFLARLMGGHYCSPRFVVATFLSMSLVLLLFTGSSFATAISITTFSSAFGYSISSSSPSSTTNNSSITKK